MWYEFGIKIYYIIVPFYFQRSPQNIKSHEFPISGMLWIFFPDPCGGHNWEVERTKLAELAQFFTICRVRRHQSASRETIDGTHWRQNCLALTENKTSTN